MIQSTANHLGYYEILQKMTRLVFSQKEKDTREAAKLSGQKTYVCDSSCKYGHLPCLRYVSNNRCKTCFLEAEKSPKRVAQKKVYKASPKHKQTLLDYVSRPDIKVKTNERARAANLRPEVKSKRREYGLEYNRRPYVKEKGTVRSQLRTEQRKIDPALNQKLLESSRRNDKRRQTDPVIRKERQRYMANYASKPEVRQRIRANAAKPERKERAEIHRKIYCQRPEVKEGIHRRSLRAARIRELARQQRTPSWADEEKIREIYNLAKKIRKETGVKHEVDHIIPLRGKLVSGLHVPENLRIITEHENRVKRNSFDPETFKP